MPIAFHLDMKLDQLTSWVERMPHAVMIADDQGKIVAVNDRCADVLQYPKEEVLGQLYTRFIALPGEVDAYIRHTDRYDEQLQSVEGNLLDRNGSSQPASIQVISGKSRQGWYHLLLLIPAPRFSLLQEFVETLVADLHLGLVILDEQGRVYEINKAASRMLGVDRQEILDQPAQGLFVNVSMETGGDLPELLVGQTPVRHQEASWVKGESCYQVVADHLLLKRDNGEAAGSCLVLKDVTKLHSLEMQIRRTDRLAMIGQIAAGTAHEIRNPLTSIKGFLQVMKHALKEKGEMKEQGYTEIMLREIDRINDLVSEFLLLSKPKSIRMHPVDVDHVLRELLPIIQNEAILHNVEVRYKPEKPVPKVVADSELLKQVFLNLCKNGIEAMGDGGVLTIRVRQLRREKKMAVEVHDMGPGIPVHAMEKIFDPFFTTKENGTGLGLSVCQRIVHDIGGHIHVSSKGLGTTFSVLLPDVES